MKKLLIIPILFIGCSLKRPESKKIQINSLPKGYVIETHFYCNDFIVVINSGGEISRNRLDVSYRFIINTGDIIQ